MNCCGGEEGGGEGDTAEFDRMPNMSTICRFILTKPRLFHYYAFKLKIPVTQMGYYMCENRLHPLLTLI